VTKVYFQLGLHASPRFMSLFNVEVALAAHMSPAVRPTRIFPGVPAGQSTTGYMWNAWSFCSRKFCHENHEQYAFVGETLSNDDTNVTTNPKRPSSHL